MFFLSFISIGNDFVMFVWFTWLIESIGFSLVILNSLNHGIAVTGLHSRESTRIYTKLLKNGKPAEGEFSKEEEAAFHQATKGEKTK